ncbi:MAG: response regulator [Verrucomicrobia bacterium]|nr:response regulator [Verrucomicrobiota bacterium]
MDTKECGILLVEDNPDDVLLTQRAFAQQNILNSITVVGDGEEALEYLFAEGAYKDRKGHPFPSVVLLDIKLPKLGGLEALEKIRSDPRTKFLPVVMLTSSKEEVDLVESYKRGANSYVRKPVDFDEFSDAVRQLGLYWLLINEPPPRT